MCLIFVLFDEYENFLTTKVSRVTVRLLVVLSVEFMLIGKMKCWINTENFCPWKITWHTCSSTRWADERHNPCTRYQCILFTRVLTQCGVLLMWLTVHSFFVVLYILYERAAVIWELCSFLPLSSSYVKVDVFVWLLAEIRQWVKCLTESLVQ